MSKNNIFYGVIIFVLAILVFGSTKYNSNSNVGIAKANNTGFGITHDWVKH